MEGAPVLPRVGGFWKKDEVKGRTTVLMLGVGWGDPSLERWMERPSVAGEKREREGEPGPAAARWEGHPDTRQVGMRVANLALHLGSGTCRLPAPAQRLWPHFFSSPSTPFLTQVTVAPNAARTSFALLSGAALLAFNL